jgi:hypothetical protein
MSRGKCQICGRLYAIGCNGIVRHYRNGNLCLGTYNPPVSISLEAIPAAIEHWTEQDNRCAIQFNHDRERRSNEPLTAEFWKSWAYASRERSRLITRMRRLEGIRR